MDKDFTNADGLHNYRRQLILLERENKKAISAPPRDVQSASSTPLTSPQVLHRFNHSMLPPSSVISPQTSGSPNPVAMQMSAMTGSIGIVGAPTAATQSSAGATAVKKRKYTRRKVDSTKRSLSEPNSPATPITPFTSSTLTLASTLTTVTEHPQHELSSALLEEDERKKKRPRKSLSVHPTPPFSTDSLMETVPSGNANIKKNSHASSVTAAVSGAVSGAVSMNKLRMNGKKAMGVPSNKKAPAPSGTVQYAAPPGVITAAAPFAAVPTAEDLLSGSSASTESVAHMLPLGPNSSGLSPSHGTGLDTLHDDPTLSGDVPFQFDQEDADLLASVKKPIDVDVINSAISTDTANPGSAAGSLAASVTNPKDQDTFNLDFSDPNSNYNDFNFFQFSWR